MLSNINEIEFFFDSHADEYYEHRAVRGGTLFNEFIEMPATKELLGTSIDEKTTILDIGCGIGSYAQYYGQLGAKVTGIDVSSKMISIAQNVCSGLENVNFIRGSFENLDVTTNSFDYIIGGFMLGYFQNLHLAFKKISLLLKDGGCVVLSMLHPVKVSIKKMCDGLFCLSNYFENSEYTTDLSFSNGTISLKKWSIEDIIVAARACSLIVDSVKEPRPELPPDIEIDRSDYYISCPSVIVFRFKKIANE